MEKRKEGRPGEARAALRRSVRDNVYDSSCTALLSFLSHIFLMERHFHLILKEELLLYMDTLECIWKYDEKCHFITNLFQVFSVEAGCAL